MTVIIAARYKNTVVVGSDSLVTRGYDKQYTEKLVKFKKKAIVGSCGILTMKMVLDDVASEEKFVKKLKLETSSDIRSFAKVLFSKLREEFEYNNNESLLNESSVLIATPHKIFEVDPYFCTYEVKEFNAIGSGADLALGAMTALYPNLTNEQDLYRMVERALEIACKYNNGCAPPYSIYKVGK